MKLSWTPQRGAICAVVALLFFFFGRFSTQFIGSLATWPPKPDWMDIEATGVVVNCVVAAGTVAAAWIALHIALGSRRKQINDDRVAAQLTAAGAAPRLENSRSKTANVLEIVSTARQLLEASSEPSRETLAELRRHASDASAILNGVSYCTFDEIRSMASLPGNCAMQIEAAQGRVRVANSSLEEIGQVYEKLLADLKAVAIEDNIAAFGEISDKYSSAGEIGKVYEKFHNDLQTIAIENDIPVPSEVSDKCDYELSELLELHSSLVNDLIGMAWSIIDLICLDAYTRLEEAEILFTNAHKICSGQSAVIDDLILSTKITA